MQKSPRQSLVCIKIASTSIKNLNKYFFVHTHTFDSIINLLKEGAPVDIFQFDFKKAFDRVPHNRLIYKLKCLGIYGNLLDVIKDFLMGRSLRVSVEGKLSSIKDVLSGISQGSVLGP